MNKVKRARWYNPLEGVGTEEREVTILGTTTSGEREGSWRVASQYICIYIYIYIC